MAFYSEYLLSSTTYRTFTDVHVFLWSSERCPGGDVVLLCFGEASRTLRQGCTALVARPRLVARWPVLLHTSRESFQALGLYTSGIKELISIYLVC